jgi:hypothetical protein
MAKHDSTDLIALAADRDIDNSSVSSSLELPLQSHTAAAGPVLGLVQLEVLKATFSRRVMQAVAIISDAARQRTAIITGYRTMGAELVATFNVGDIVDIPSRQFAAALQFLEGFELGFVRKAAAQA